MDGSACSCAVRLAAIALALAAAGCGEGPQGAAPTSTAAPSTIPVPTTAVSTAPPTAGTIPAPTTIPPPTTVPTSTTTTTVLEPSVPLGAITGTIEGWPADAAMCSATLQVWGPWPYRLAEVACDPHAVRPMRFDFDLLPAGDWGIRAWLTWTDADGVEHSRLNEFPETPGPGAEWITVNDGETTTVDLTADRPGGRITGPVIDDRMGSAISGQYEPGTSLIHVLVYSENGERAGAGGNGCDGTYEVWLPDGRYALAADDWTTGYWSDAWMPDGQPFVVPLGSDPYVAIDPASIPAGAWVTVIDGRTTEVTVRLEPGPEWREPAVGEWWPWVTETVAGEPLNDGHAWRDRLWWVGRSVSFDESTETWPPGLLVDGEPTGLRGWPEPSDRWGSGLVVVAVPSPPPGLSGTGGEPSYRPAYRIVLAADPVGAITDVLYVEPGTGEFVAANGRAPHAPDTWFVVRGRSGTTCSHNEGPAVQAWRLTEGRFVDVDPTGVSVVPDW